MVDAVAASRPGHAIAGFCREGRGRRRVTSGSGEEKREARSTIRRVDPARAPVLDFAPIVSISAKTGKAWARPRAGGRCMGRAPAPRPTGALNGWWATRREAGATMVRAAPEAVHDTQVGVAPPTFVFFARDAGSRSTSHIADYLENGWRQFCSWDADRLFPEGRPCASRVEPQVDGGPEARSSAGPRAQEGRKRRSAREMKTERALSVASQRRGLAARVAVSGAAPGARRCGPRRAIRALLLVTGPNETDEHMEKKRDNQNGCTGSSSRTDQVTGPRRLPRRPIRDSGRPRRTSRVMGRVAGAFAVRGRLSSSKAGGGRFCMTR